MAKEFVKGVTVGEATAEENTQPTVSTVETNEEETKQVIKANEEDFIAGLIAAADFASDEEETQRVEIFRNGKLAFAFYIRPLGSTVLQLLHGSIVSRCMLPPFSWPGNTYLCSRL